MYHSHFDLKLPIIRCAIVLMCVAMDCVPLKAQDGSAAYNFLNVTSSSRIYGLGGVNITSIEDNVMLSDQNPALLGPEMSNQLAFNYMRYLGDSNFAGLNYTHAAGDKGAWQLSMRYFGYGDMVQTDESGMVLGNFSPKDVSFGGGYTRDLSEYVRGGFLVKFIYSAYEQYSAFAIATDLGVNYFDPENNLSMSMTVTNLGGQVKRFADAYDRLPIDVRLGWSKMWGTLPIRFSLTAWNLTKWHLPYYDVGDGSGNQTPKIKDTFASNLFRHLVFAADFIPTERFYIALGYNYKTRTDMSTYKRNILSGFSLGTGLTLPKFNVGVSVGQPHTGALTMMFNLTVNMDDLL